jgi:hypothetical protein
MALPLPPNYNDPIPNSPFYYPQEEAVASASGPLVVGAGLAVDYADGTLVAAGGGLANINTTLPLYLTGIQSNPVINIETANKSRLGVIQVGPNLNLSGVGVVDVLQSSTSQKGIVQLYDSTSSTSKSLALTARQGYLLQQQINALVLSTDLVFSGVFNPVTSQMETVTDRGLQAGFVLGANLPYPSAENKNHFVIASEAGTYTPPGSSTPVDANVGSWFLSNGTEWRYLRISEQVPYATETSAGLIRLATTQEAIDGTNDTAAITPLKMSEVSVEKDAYTAKGDLLTATGAATVTALPVGTDGQFLSANANCAEGMEWVDRPPSIPCSVIGNCGSIVVGNGPGSPTSLPLGYNTQYLRVNYNCPTGMEWVTATNAFAIPCACLTAAGGLVTANGPSSPVALPRGNEGQQLVVCTACSETGGLTWTDPPADGFALIENCRQGAFVVSNGAGGLMAGPYTFPLGSEIRQYVLALCESCPSGLAWTLNEGLPVPTYTNSPDDTGAIPVGEYGGGYIMGKLYAGNDGEVLTVDRSCCLNLKWAPATTPQTFGGALVPPYTIDKGQTCCYTILPDVSYPAGCYLVNVWGYATSTSGDASVLFYLNDSPELWMTFPNTASRTPISLSWTIDTTITPAPFWCSYNATVGSTGARAVDVVTYFTALKIG